MQCDGLGQPLLDETTPVVSHQFKRTRMKGTWSRHEWDFAAFPPRSSRSREEKDPSGTRVDSSLLGDTPARELSRFVPTACPHECATVRNTGTTENHQKASIGRSPLRITFGEHAFIDGAAKRRQRKMRHREIGTFFLYRNGVSARSLTLNLFTS